nr:helix-turn-helix domain-containing protein [Lentzea sp. NBRC 105346]
MGNSGSPTKSPGRRFTTASRKAILARLKKGYAEGASIRALAEREGLSYGTVRSWLIDAGVALRPKSVPGRPWSGQQSTTSTTGEASELKPMDSLAPTTESGSPS